MSEENDYFDDDYITDDTPSIDQIALAKKAEADERENRELAKVTTDMRHNWTAHMAAAAAVLIVAALVGWAWMRYWNPVVSQAQMAGYVTEIKCEGRVFKTFEGRMLTSGFLYDTVQAPVAEIRFSVESDTLARALMEEQLTGRLVTMDYKEYSGALPWRGSSRRVVTSVEPRGQ